MRWVRALAGTGCSIEAAETNRPKRTNQKAEKANGPCIVRKSGCRRLRRQCRRADKKSNAGRSEEEPNGWLNLGECRSRHECKHRVIRGANLSSSCEVGIQTSRETVRSVCGRSCGVAGVTEESLRSVADYRGVSRTIDECRGLSRSVVEHRAALECAALVAL